MCERVGSYAGGVKGCEVIAGGEVFAGDFCELGEGCLEFSASGHFREGGFYGGGFGFGTGDFHHFGEDAFVDVHGHFHEGMGEVPYRMGTQPYGNLETIKM